MLKRIQFLYVWNISLGNKYPKKNWALVYKLKYKENNRGKCDDLAKEVSTQYLTFILIAHYIHSLYSMVVLFDRDRRCKHLQHVEE